MTAPRVTCRTVMVDGEPVVVRWAGEPAADDLEAIQEVVAAVRRAMDARPPRPRRRCADCGTELRSGYVRCPDCIAQWRRQ